MEEDKLAKTKEKMHSGPLFVYNDSQDAGHSEILHFDMSAGGGG